MIGGESNLIGGDHNIFKDTNYSIVNGNYNIGSGNYNNISGNSNKNLGNGNIIGGDANNSYFSGYNIIAGASNKHADYISNLSEDYYILNEDFKYEKLDGTLVTTSLSEDDYVEFNKDYTRKIYKVIDSTYTIPYDPNYFDEHLATDWEYETTYQPGDYVSRYYVYQCITTATGIDPSDDSQHQYYIQLTNSETPAWDPSQSYHQNDILIKKSGYGNQYFYKVKEAIDLSDSFVLYTSNIYNCGGYSAIFGYNNNFNGRYNLIAGQNNIIYGNNVYGLGEGLLSFTNNQLILGKYNIPEDNKALIIGNGTNENNRLNVFTIDKNGKIGFGPGTGNFIIQTNSGRAITVDANSHNNSIFGGDNTITASEENFVSNFGHTVSNTKGSFISGSGNKITGGNAQTITGGGNFIENGTCNFITNGGNKIKNGSNNTIEGGGNYFLGDDSKSCNHLEGGGNQVYGNQSHVEGGGNRGYNSIYNTHIEGGGNKAYDGENNHIEGAGCCIGNTSHSHVEGKYNISGIPYLKRDISTAAPVPYIDFYDATKTYEVGDYVTYNGTPVTLD